MRPFRLAIAGRRSAAALLCLVAALCALASVGASRALAGLAILQRSEGIPGTSGGERDYQLLVGSGKFKLVDARSKDARYVIARLDRQVYWEVDPKLEEYRELEFQTYRMQRSDAERNREKSRLVMIEKRDKGTISDAELEKWLRENASRKDGSRDVTVQRSPWTVRDGYRQQRVVIELNGVTQVAVWQTDRYEGKYVPPKELFDFYDQMSLFPEEVSRALLREVKLFPVEVYANIDFFAKGAEITTKVLSVVDWPENAAEFELPPGLHKVDRFSEQKVAEKEWKCPICGKPVDPRTATMHDKDPRTGEKVFFDREDCFLEFQDVKRGAKAGAKTMAPSRGSP